MGEKIVKKGIFIPNCIWEDDNLSSVEEKIMFSLIHLLDNEDKHCFASNAFFIQRTKKAERNVQICLKNLEQKGYVEKKFNLYKNERILISNLRPFLDENDVCDPENQEKYNKVTAEFLIKKQDIGGDDTIRGGMMTSSGGGDDTITHNRNININFNRELLNSLGQNPDSPFSNEKEELDICPSENFNQQIFKEYSPKKNKKKINPDIKILNSPTTQQVCSAVPKELRMYVPMLEKFLELGFWKHRADWEKPSKLLLRCLRYLSQIHNGTFLKGKVWEQGYVLAKEYEDKKHSLEELEKILSTVQNGLKFAFKEGYWPLSKETLPKALDALFYNPMTHKSWFLYFLKNEPKLLARSANRANELQDKVYENAALRKAIETFNFVESQREFIFANILKMEQWYEENLLDLQASYKVFSTWLGTFELFFEKYCKSLPRSGNITSALFQIGGVQWQNFDRQIEMEYDGAKLTPWKKHEEIERIKLDEEVLKEKVFYPAELLEIYRYITQHKLSIYQENEDLYDSEYDNLLSLPKLAIYNFKKFPYSFYMEERHKKYLKRFEQIAKERIK